MVDAVAAAGPEIANALSEPQSRRGGDRQPRHRGPGGRGLGKTVKLGFTFPAEASVLREEVVEAIKLANRAAAKTAGALPAVVGMAAALSKEGSGQPDG
jgi:hypothetical protein